MRNFVIPAMAVALISGGAAAQAVFVTPSPDLGQCRSYTSPDEQTRCLNRLNAGLTTTMVPGTTTGVAVPSTTMTPSTTMAPAVTTAPTSGTRALGTEVPHRAGDSAVGNAGGAGVGVGSSTGTAPGGGMGTRGSGNQGSSGTGR
jgi:hypothetical protein